jgi:hypothetical protein
MTLKYTDTADTTFFSISCHTPRRRLRVVSRGPGAIIPARQESWDLCDVFWHPEEIKDVLAGKITSDADFVILDRDRSLRKLGLIRKLFSMADFWRGYESVMLADDDMELIGCTVEEMFDLFEKTGSHIAQPALTADSSHISHAITRQELGCVWRETNFVEMAVPIFTRAALLEYLPSFAETVSGWGVDFYWSMKEIDAGRHLAILDKTPVRHGRAIGAGGYYEGLRVEPGQEMREFLERQGLWARMDAGFRQEVFTKWHI